VTIFGVTKFSDLTPEEFKEIYLMKNLPPRVVHPSEYTYYPNVNGPASFDWRNKGGVTAVKNQEQCGSCWAFSATENIESVYKLAGHSIPTLGPQQIVDCDPYDYGCGGGWPYNAFKYVIGAGGQDMESCYPYTAQDGTCNFQSNCIGAKIGSYQNIATDETQIQNALVSVAPLSICVDASSWSSYQGGVMTADNCGDGIDHCVQLVGYDSTASTPYWIVRNSWGTDWGISGYIYLQMGQNTCAMDNDVTTAVAA